MFLLQSQQELESLKYLNNISGGVSSSISSSVDNANDSGISGIGDVNPFNRPSVVRELDVSLNFRLNSAAHLALSMYTSLSLSLSLFLSLSLYIYMSRSRLMFMYMYVYVYMFQVC